MSLCDGFLGRGGRVVGGERGGGGVGGWGLILIGGMGGCVGDEFVSGGRVAQSNGGGSWGGGFG